MTGGAFSHASITVRGISFTQSISMRITSRIRRAFFPQRNFWQNHRREGHLSHCSLEAAGRARRFYFRNQTTDEAVIRQIFYGRHYDFTRLARCADIQALLEKEHGRGRQPLILDAGANIGASSVFFALMFPGALVVAIEPEDNNYRLLCKNIVGLNVVTVQAALSAQFGRAAVLDAGIGSWGFRTRKTEDEDGVACVTVGSLYDKFIGTAYFPFLVKIDIEGGEKDVFETNTEWVERTPILVAELHDSLFPRAGISSPFLRCVSSLDRDFVLLGEGIASIANTFPSR
jgi:FkbM family methyltransferase